MSNTKFLVVEDLDGDISTDMVAFINARNNGRADLRGVYVDLQDGATYRELREAYRGYSPIKGYGSLRDKDGVEYWILPFASSDELPNIDNAQILNKAEYLSFGWTVEEVI
jgi:hypothetical protein